MSSSNGPRSHSRRKPGSAKSIRQTRMRSRLAGAAPLMRGLDDKGLPRDALPEDPENLPFDQVFRKVRRIKIILRPQVARGPKNASCRPRIIIRMTRTKSNTSKVTSWGGDDSRSSSVRVLETLYRESLGQSGENLVGGDTKRRVRPLAILLSMLPKLYTDF
ncbi:hypothetical protein V2A60_001857 [Cordyceps javanica]